MKEHHRFMKRQHMVWGAILVTFVMLGITGCEFLEREDAAAPTALELDVFEGLNGTYGSEHGVPFSYQPGEVSGIEILGDFNEYHISGQPYGTWVIHATWRNAERSIVEEVDDVYVAFTIDANGIGRALLPASFLDQVFAAAASLWQTSQDQSVWHRSPGLYLNFIPGSDTLPYYDFDDEVPEGWAWHLCNWSFGESLSALTEDLGLNWWPGLAPLTNVAAFADIGYALGVCLDKPVEPAEPAAAACLPAWADCEFDEECCSGVCTIDDFCEETTL